MKKTRLVMLALLALPGLGFAQEPPGAGEAAADEAILVDTNSADWVVKTGDNVCGVSEARQISNPAKVKYDALMRATPEMKEMKRKGIDKDSARGMVLISEAKARIKLVAKVVMTDKGHCSVWKKISHKRGRSATDITDTVLLKLES